MYLVRQGALHSLEYYAFVRQHSITVIRAGIEDIAFFLDPSLQSRYSTEVQLFFRELSDYTFCTPYGETVRIVQKNGSYTALVNGYEAFSTSDEHPYRLAQFVRWIQGTKPVLLYETNEHRAIDLLRLLPDRRKCVELIGADGYVLLAAFRGEPHELIDWDWRGVSLLQSCEVRGKKIDVLTGTVNYPVFVDGEPIRNFSILRTLLTQSM